MKYNYWLIITLFIFSFNANSQKCKVSKDPFTNEKTVEIKFKERLGKKES